MCVPSRDILDTVASHHSWKHLTELCRRFTQFPEKRTRRRSTGYSQSLLGTFSISLVSCLICVVCAACFSGVTLEMGAGLSPHFTFPLPSPARAGSDRDFGCGRTCVMFGHPVQKQQSVSAASPHEGLVNLWVRWR
jgi:hypothetical protein